MRLSVIVCTYNRASILQECLTSFLNQSAKEELFEVLIIDNNSIDNTKLIVSGFISTNPNFAYHFEPRQGLSYARNTGFKVAKANWVAYIDDDTRVFPGFVERALWTIDNFHFDGFGGLAIPLYLKPKPKWFPRNLELFFINGISEPCTLTDAFFHGYAMVFRKDVLIKMNGFPINLGMSGEKIAYGEETMLQKKMKNAGLKLGYDPGLKVYHVIGKHKFKLSWHIKSAFSHGRDTFDIFFFNYTASELLKDLFFIVLIKWPKAIAKFFLRKEFYWQNMILEMFQPIAVCLGKYKAAKEASS